MKHCRSHEKEWMDLGPPYYNDAEYDHCLQQLGRIGRYLGGDRATFQALGKLKSPPRSILDVGCGGGAFTVELAKRYPKAKVTGIDTSAAAIDYANRQLQSMSPPITNIEFILSSNPRLDSLQKKFDVVTSTLVCHHLSDDELIVFLKDAYKIANQAVIFNDLHRHSLATLGYRVIAPLLFRNKMITHDGLLSIKRSFIRKEWDFFMASAEIPKSSYSIAWQWAFRWIITINI